MKKLLFTIFLLVFAVSFSQENEKNAMNSVKKENRATITAVSAYPNPFNARTRINFRSTKDQVIEFTVKNLLGKTVYLETFEASEGYNAIPFIRNDIPKGMYIYTLKTEVDLISKRMVIR